jgi:hypothetical protein
MPPDTVGAGQLTVAPQPDDVSAFVVNAAKKYMLGTAEDKVEQPPS